MSCASGEAERFVCTHAMQTAEQLQFPFREREASCVYLSLYTETETECYDAWYLCRENRAKGRMPHIRVIICTYRRREALEENLARLRASRFFDTEDALYGRLSVCVVDNASELPSIREPLLRLCHNPNTGGSGGFGRGIREARQDEAACGITHVVFMDDDARVQMESFYRLYALLALQKREYRDAVVAGRMFCLGQEQVQYTAAEIWNGGELRHVGWKLDMRKRENLRGVNAAELAETPCGAAGIRETEHPGIRRGMGCGREAEYGGWWFACYPMEFVRRNDPLPFFLHCDDVEYGLRHRREHRGEPCAVPMLLNGIQVWHETAEMRQDVVMAYYDVRNALVVNAIYGKESDAERFLAPWRHMLARPHPKGDYRYGYMAVRALRDFLRGPEWFFARDAERENRILRSVRPRWWMRYYNAIGWRVQERSAGRKIGRVREEWQKNNLKEVSCRKKK